MSLVRVLRTAQVVLSHTFYIDELATSATGSVTYSIKRLDGTVVAAGTAGGPVTAGVYTVTVPAQTSVDMLTLDWTGTVGYAAVTARDYVEVVGGFIFGLSMARAMPPPLDATRYPAATLARRRIGVEQECERICGRAFVPRFARHAVNVSNPDKLVLPNVDVRALRAVSVGDTAVSLSGLAVTESGVVSGGAWAAMNPAVPVVVEYEYGLDSPPADLEEACMLRLRSRLEPGNTGVPYRAQSFTVADGGTYRLSMPSGERTGIAEVDAAYERHTVLVGGFA